MNPVTFEKSELPTAVDGQRRREARSKSDPALARCDATGRTDHRPSLYAQCMACGAAGHDWRRLLGVGAKLAARSIDSRSVVLSYPRACSTCGCSDLVVTALGAAELRAAALAGLLAPAVTSTQ
jgi:hypothetical protein